MNIEYPPMLAGNSREQILQLRSYLFRLADSLSLSLSETIPQEADAVAEVEQLQKGQRLIVSAPDGWSRGTRATEYSTNLAAIDDMSIFTAVVSANADMSDAFTVPLTRYGNTISGSVTVYPDAESAPVTFIFGITADTAGDMSTMKLTTAYYVQHNTDGNGQFVLPGTLSGKYVIRKLYATVV